VKTFYSGLSPEQLDQLKLRGLDTATIFMDQVSGDFFPTAQARQPNFGASLRAAVAIGMIKRALAPTDFLNFGSAKAMSHQDMVGENILESQPHDNVHGAVGGFMGQFLSPVDPIFFMHHSNLDRLWDVWTRKQEKLGRATLPTGDDLVAWNKEPFLFYVDPSGKPVAKTTAGDYATIGDFGYAYQPGSGEDVIPTRVDVAAAAGNAAAAGKKEFAGTLSREHLDFQTPTVAQFNVPEGLMRAATANDGTELVARVTLELPDNPVGMRFHVVVNPPQGARNLRFTEPSFAGTIAPFGRHLHGHKSGPVFFDVPLTGAVKKLHAAEMLGLDQPLQVRVVPDTEGVTLTPFTTPLKSISIISV
jgi:tyrosinase